jgi:hypothetical protein
MVRQYLDMVLQLCLLLLQISVLNIPMIRSHNYPLLSAVAFISCTVAFASLVISLIAVISCPRSLSWSTSSLRADKFTLSFYESDVTWKKEIREACYAVCRWYHKAKQ